jgi:hypothetical protein
MRVALSVIRGNFDQTEPQGRELGNGEGLRSGNRVTQRKHELKGTGVQHQANLVGRRRATCGAVRGELRLVRLDEVLCLAARHTRCHRTILRRHASGWSPRRGCPLPRQLP